MGDQEQKSKQARVERLRRRLAEAVAFNSVRKMGDVLKGVLDLLEDEL